VSQLSLDPRRQKIGLACAIALTSGGMFWLMGIIHSWGHDPIK
jgi:hypothetical protein